MSEGMLFSDPRWVEEQKMAKKVPPSKKIHAALQRMHGAMPGRKCAQCAFLGHVQPGANVYLKCAKSGKQTHGPGTDWRAGWEACGLFENREEE